MVSLLKIRGMLEQMSVIERKLADFILENANLLRDYSSQQLADAVGTSQSSVVKFCQKLGYKGYPDLKLAVSEAIITASTLNRNDKSANETVADGLTVLVENFQFSLITHLRAMLEINDPKALRDAYALLLNANSIFIAGYGKSAIVAQDMQYRLLQLGKQALLDTDPTIALQLVNTLPDSSLVFLISESGQNKDLLVLAKHAQQRNLRCLSLTSYQSNALNNLADVALFSLNSDDTLLTNPLLVQMAQQHLCHILYLMLQHKLTS
jgi:DNA-binding MurR/RpiR family transcriptional regulator